MTEQQSKGLPMTARWDPDKLQREIADLQALDGLPFLQRAGAYLKRTGPGLLQSAMTLGAGSAAASVVAGASFGYTLLWVQPVAMFLGICMFAALGNVVLTTGERPYAAFGRELHKSVAFLWALGTRLRAPWPPSAPPSSSRAACWTRSRNCWASRRRPHQPSSGGHSSLGVLRPLLPGCFQP